MMRFGMKSSYINKSGAALLKCTSMTILSLVVASGCNENRTILSAKVYEVKGQVLKADGAPVTSGRVVLVPSDETAVQASGDITGDGSFTVKTRLTDEGAVPGKYKVRIEPSFEDSRKGPKKLKYPYKYTDEDSSGLIVTVKAEPNRLEPFRLK
jgi:hypothetical protein